ncbi:hypothetical protein [Desulfosediminicola sp.]|uniref:hypothetical protein n=1 Tax=Desulfosediminicola sp. TaxID=2886825 RepID=UPI003AF22EEA
MNHYVIETVLKEKRQDMLQEAERLRHIREYEKSLQAGPGGRSSPIFIRLIGKLEIAVGGALIRAGVWLTKRQMRKGYGLACKS